MRRCIASTLVALTLSGQPTAFAAAQQTPAAPAPPNVLLVVAHPDDDAMFAGSVYKITHTLNGNVDLALVTDGSGGFRYAQLAEPIYGLDLTDETIARQHLPAIRKRELMAGGQIVGLRNYFFLDQLDDAYTENVDSVFTEVWDTAAVRSRLRQIMTRVRYDYVYVHLPIPNFHAHHRAASILALEAAQSLPGSQRPVVLGCFVGSRSDPGEFDLRDFRQHPGFPITAVRQGTPPFVFDRTQALSPDGRLDYRIVVNWLIAEHRTQGTMQLLVNRGDIERFWFFEMNDPAAFATTEEFFQLLAEPVYDSPNR